MADYQVNTIADLSNLSVGAGDDEKTADVAGYWEIGDTVTRRYQYDHGSSITANGGTIVESSNGRWNLIQADSVAIASIDYYDSAWFGTAEGRTDNNDRIVKAIEAVLERTDGGGKEVRIGKYVLDSSMSLLLNESHNGISILGSEVKLKRKNSGTPLTWEQILDPGFDIGEEDYPVVDEDESSILRRHQDAGGTIHFFYEAKDPDATYEDITVKNIAINGNRDNLPPGSSGINMQKRPIGGGGLSNYRPCNNLLYEKIISFGSSADSNGLNHGYENAVYKHILVYNCSNHGVGSADAARNVLFDGLFVHNAGRPDVGYGINLSSTNDNEYRNFRLTDNNYGTKVASSNNITLRNGIIEYSDLYGFTMWGGGPSSNLVVDNVISRHNGRAGFRIGNNSTNARFGRIYAYNNGSVVDKNIYIATITGLEFDHITSADYDGNETYSIRDVVAVDYTVRSAYVYSNKGAWRVADGSNLILANAKFHDNGVGFRNDGTIKYSRIVDGNNDPFSLPGTTIELPRCNNVVTQINGDDLDLSVTVEQGDESLSGASLKFYRADPNVFPHEFHELGDGTLNGSTWELTVTNYESVFDEGVDYVIFAEITTAGGDKSIESRDPENGSYDETIFSWGTAPTTAPEVPTLSSPADNAVDVSTRPELEVESQSNTDTITFQIATDNNDFANTIVVEQTVSGFSHTLTSAQELDNDTEYHWRAYATNDHGDSDPSATRSFTTVGAIPGVVTRISPTNGATGISLNPTLTWQATDGANKYQLAVWVSGESPIVDNEELGNVTEYALSNLDPGKTYNWNIRAGNDAGWGNWTGAWTFTTESAIQTLSVESDIALGDWTVTDATDGADALASLDDESYIGTDVVDGDPYIGKLSSSGKQLPNNKEGWRIKDVRARKTSESVFVSIYEYDDGGDFNLTNYNNNKTLIEKIEVDNLTDSFSDVDINISEAGSITDIHDLYIELSFESGGG